MSISVPPPERRVDEPRDRWPHIGRGLLSGALGIAVVTALKLLQYQAIGPATPFLLYFGAVVAATWFGGWTAGLAATLGAAVVADAMFMADPGGLVSLEQSAVFCVECVVLVWLTASLQRTSHLARANARAAHDALARLEVVMNGVDESITVQDAAGKLVFANELAARSMGVDTAAELIAMPASEVLRRFELFDADGAAFPLDRLPGRTLFAGGPASEALVRFRRRDTGEERWSMVRAAPVRDPEGQLVFAINLFRDVTERHRHDEALRISEQWLATTLRSIGDAVIATAADERIAFLNPAAEQLTGWPSAEAAGRPLREVFQIFSERTREPAEAPVKRVLRDGRVVGLANHTILRRRDGNEVAIDDSAAPIRDPRGAIVGVVLVFRDVSAVRREEARRAFLARATELLASSLDYERTLAAVADAAVPELADWCIIDLAAGRSQTSGGPQQVAVAHVDPRRREQVLEQQRREPPGPPDPPEPGEPRGAAHVLRTGEVEWFPRIARERAPAADHGPPGTDPPELSSYIGVPIRSGDAVIGAITLAMADSHRRYEDQDLATVQALADRAAVAIENARLYRETEALRRDEAVQRDRLQAMVMAAPIAICVLRGSDLVFEMMNEPYRSRFNASARQGARITDVVIDDVTVATLKRVLATGETARAIEAPVTADYADGRQTHYVSYVVQPLHASDGGVDRLVVFANDVTDQVIARRQLEDAHRQAQAANRAKDEFLAILGHELRNPLAPIVTALELAEQRGPEVFARTHATIDRQVRHMIRLVDDLLDVSRIARGKVELQRETVVIADVVSQAIEQMAPALASGHTLEVAIAPGLTTRGDPLRLAQIIANLLGNAIKYTPRTGRIDITGRRDGNDIVLVVRDTGIGIEPDMLPRVFELFVQERKALDRAGGGLGLGLAIVRALVEQHGGTVVARSEGADRGTEVEVRLPATEAAVAGEPAPAAVRGTATAPTRVLLVDDNTDALELLALGLESRGHVVSSAPDGPTALSLASDARPMVAILDIGLPGMDGYELARRLRAEPSTQEIKLIAVTGYGQSSDRLRALAAGFDEHLVKPVTVEAVAVAIGRLQHK